MASVSVNTNCTHHLKPSIGLRVSTEAISYMHSVLPPGFMPPFSPTQSASPSSVAAANTTPIATAPQIVSDPTSNNNRSSNAGMYVNHLALSHNNRGQI